jgi:hypothetical protein
MEKVRLYDPGRLLITTISLDRVKNAENFVARKAQNFEDKALADAPIYLDEVINSFKHNANPSYKALKRVAAGSLPDLVARSNGTSLLKRFIDLIISIGGSVLYKSLLLGYLRIRHDESALTELIRQALINGEKQLPQRWKDRIKKYGLLDKPAGKKLASLALSSSELNPIQVFEDAGLKKGILLGGGFAASAFNEFCTIISIDHGGEKLTRFFSILPENLTNKSDERVQLTESSLQHVALALLKPYLERDPSDEVRRKIIEKLVNLYRDPRLNPMGWATVDQDLVSVLLRWLTAESFEMLMEVLNSSNQSTQWMTREKFWKGYIDKGYVKEAWVAFGPDAEIQASKLIRSGQLRSRGSFGVLERSQIQGHHSVLFMKVGDLTISEWTHDGKVRFYRSRNNSKPELYKLRYDPEVLRRDSRADHFKVHLGRWQNDVAGYIRDITGFRNPGW